MSRENQTPEVLSTCAVIEEEPFDNADDESDFPLEIPPSETSETHKDVNIVL